MHYLQTQILFFGLFKYKEKVDSSIQLNPVTFVSFNPTVHYFEKDEPQFRDLHLT
jgi:hypothetical protein